LRTFSRDRFVHYTLALLLATFTYALTVLRTVRTADDERAQFVPSISVTVAFVLTLASVIGLVLFLAHLARKIRVETLLDEVHREAAAAAVRLLPDDPERHGRLPVPPESARHLSSPASGFLSSVDDAELLSVAVADDLVVSIDRPAGVYVPEGVPVGWFWRAGDRDHPDDAIADRLAAALSFGFERTDTQDYALGLRQLADVAVKALSPGINDPTTAAHALRHSSALLTAIARRDPGPLVMRDEKGSIRVVIDRPTLEHLLDLAMTQPRRYGRNDPIVLARLFELLRELAWAVSAGGDAARATSDQLARLRATVAAGDFDEAERAGMDELARDVDRALAGEWRYRPVSDR
jgi:uncharacterized membrane protein